MKLEVTVDQLKQYSIFVGAPMYGGNCAGIFTKSTNDLSAMCARYGIKLSFYYLFNESLVTRGRNYCVDEFLRSDCTHLMFIDADIGFNPKDVLSLLGIQITHPDKYDILTAPYPKKCLHSSTKIHTEDGMKTIDWVVSNAYTGKVLSFDDKHNCFEWVDVLTHSKEKNSGKRWVGLVTKPPYENSKNAPKKSVIVTEDHDIAYVDNPRDFGVKWSPAGQMKNKWIVSQVDTKHKNTAERGFPVLGKNRYSALLGSILGDGNISKSGSVTFTHSDVQLEYINFKSSVFGFGNGIYGKNGRNHGLRITSPDTKYLRDVLYPNGKKSIKNVIDNIDEVALAFMYMDDGNRYYRYKYHMEEGSSNSLWWYNTVTGKNKRSANKPDGDSWVRGRDNEDSSTASIATMAFSYEENLMLVDHLRNKFGLEASIQTQRSSRNNTEHPFVKFDRENTKKFYKLISKWIPECMEYKIDPEFRGGQKGTYEDYHGYSLKLVHDISYDVRNKNSHLFDIGVSKNKNFVVNQGLVVHNSIAWEKVKKAVELGKGENPFDLMHYAADYVFNPVANVKSFRIDQPVEVSEAGTGFMLIPRNVFERYKEAYPELSYKPDHMRTESFDGSREIMAYFDCAIDPETRRYLSEDYFFCWNARKVGIKVHMCPWMNLQHVGSYIFRGSMSALAGLDVSPTATKESNSKHYKKKKTKTGIRP